MIFREASAEKIGPELLFEGDDFRIEAFFDGKPITVWEMRNPAIMMQCCDMLARYNFNPKIRAACELVEKCDKNKLYIDTQINSWAPEVQARI